MPLDPNYSFTVVEDVAKKFSNLNTTDLSVSNLLTIGGGLQRGVHTLVDLGGAGSMPDLRPNQAGIVLVPALSGAGQILNLPPAQLGLQYHFMCTDTLTNTLELTCDAGVVEQLAGVMSMNSVSSTKTADTTLVLNAVLALGDCVTVTGVSNSVVGVCWLVRAISVAAAGFT